MLRFIPDNEGFRSDLVVDTNEKLRVGIIDADLLDHGTRHPNLALLKISAFCKELGHNVRLICNYDEVSAGDHPINFDCDYDLLVMSRVFKFTKIPNFINLMIKQHLIFYGGTGFFEVNGPNLPEDVEHHAPDYTLYNEYIEKDTGGDEKLKKRRWDDYLSYSIGFTTRGCIRHCGFCVNRLLNRVVEWSPVSEFLDENRRNIYLWDDNIMAAPPKVFAKVIEDLKKTGKPFQFRQGMDIRLMTEQKAKLLSEVKYHGDYIFAFDHYRMDDSNEKRQVEQTIKGLKIWRNHCRKSTKLYVLVAYDSQDEIDIEGTFFRIKTLMEHGCLPYIMRFEEYNNSRFKSMYTQLARWCNQPGFYKKMSFRQYCVRNEEYHQGIQDLTPKGKYNKKLKIPKGYPKKDKYCACYQTMLDFEAEFPDIAKNYFDLRFEELNPYIIEKTMKQARLTSLPIDSIKLDEDNPRIKQCLENYTTVTPEAIALALWDSGDGDAATSYRVLRDSIKDSGGIIHPIVVNHEENGDYVAIEGNTRLQIYKDFVEKNVPGEWTHITALVYEGLTKVEKHSIRLQSHLVGPRDWDPYSKAKYLFQLSEIEMLPMNSIINMCGGNKNEIIKAIDAYKYMKTYYEPYAKSQGLEPDTRDYSKFREHENARIKSAIQYKGFEYNQFAKWVVDENVDKAQSVRLIPAIMRNKDALETFLKGNLTDAETVLRAAELSNADLSEYPYEVLANELFKKLMTLPATEVEELANSDEKAMKRDALERLKSKLDFIINMVVEQEKVMAESLAHMEYVERMVKYAETIPQQFVTSMMYADLASYGQRTPKVINGFYPDLFYYDLHNVIIGEAKTTDDIDNEHTIAQLDSYIREIRTYNCERHIIICSSMIAYAQINNLVIRKKRRENIQDITFHVMDNHLRHRVI